MESFVPLLPWVIAAAALAVLAIALARRRGDPATAQRLDQLTAQQMALQGEMARQIQAQERALTGALHGRLDAMSQRMAENMEKTTKQTEGAIGAVRERLAAIDQAQKNITELSTKVVSLQDILSNKQARGAFGEIQLKDIVSQALPPAAYEFQAAIGDGRRVDCLIRMPNPPGSIPVDAKFPLEAYHLLRGAADEAARLQAARAFAVAVRKHIQDIAARYIVAGETAEAALMFLPSEAVYAELHANHPAVVAESYQSRVFIVSPTTLWATLNTMRAVLQDVKMREQAGAIQKEVGLLMQDVSRLDDRVGKFLTHLRQSDEDIRQIRISTEKIASRSERIKSLDLEDEPTPLAPPAPRLVREN
jgi:DNA recombination protein RmuC